MSGIDQGMRPEHVKAPRDETTRESRQDGLDHEKNLRRRREHEKDAEDATEEAET